MAHFHAQRKNPVKRLSLYLAAACLLAALPALPLYAQTRYTPRTTSGSSSASDGTCFVLVEKTGLDLYVGLYASVEEVKERLGLVNEDNARRKRANDDIEKAVKDLQTDIASKKRDIAKAEKENDEAAKASLEKDIARLEAEIAAKEKDLLPITKLAGPKQFPNRRTAEKYMEALYEEADKAKEAVDDKLREEERRQREREASKH